MSEQQRTDPVAVDLTLQRVRAFRVETGVQWHEETKRALVQVRQGVMVDLITAHDARRIAQQYLDAAQQAERLGLLRHVLRERARLDDTQIDAIMTDALAWMDQQASDEAALATAAEAEAAQTRRPALWTGRP